MELLARVKSKQKNRNKVGKLRRYKINQLESELVSGFMTEHSSFAFACFFLAEYSNIILMCILISDILLGGSIITVGIIIYIFIWVRSSVPRLRYDQLMSLMWKGILPLLLGSLSIEMCILTSLA